MATYGINAKMMADNSRRISGDNPTLEPGENTIIIINSRYFKTSDTILSLVESASANKGAMVTQENLSACQDKKVYVIGEAVDENGRSIAEQLFKLAKSVHFIRQI